MKSTTISGALAVAILSCNALAAVTVNFSKHKNLAHTRRRHLQAREIIYADLLNNITGGSYAVEVSVGTPPQVQNLAIDTGSSDVWVLDVRAELCTDPEAVYDSGELKYFGCASVFDSRESSTYEIAVRNAFNISYLDGSGASGDYIKDDFTIGGEKVTGQQLGYAHDSTVITGIMGIGYSLNEASNSRSTPGGAFIYPSIIDQMFDQGLINLKAYSLYLDDKSSESGSIIFGGLDSDKYIGDLLQLPIVPDTYSNGSDAFAEFTVALSSFTMIDGGNPTNLLTYDLPVVLDSGTTLTYLPTSVVSRLYGQIDAVDDSDYSGLVYADCDLQNNPDFRFAFGFGSGSDSIDINVPISELLFDLESIFIVDDFESYLPNLPWDRPCVFAIFPDQGGPSILGDSFLRSAYVVYDISNNVIALAQTNFNSSTQSILDFEADATGVPNVSGVASSADVTQTATGLLGGGNGVPTRSPSVTSSRSASSTRTTSGSGSGSGGDSTATNERETTVTVTATPTATGNAGMKTIPNFDRAGVVGLGVGAAFAVLGSMLF